MGKVQVEAIQSTETWHHKQRTGLELRIYANETFQTSTGEIWERGNPKSGLNKNYMPVPLTLNGNKLAYPDFELDTTEDSPTKADPRFSAYVFAGETLLFPRLLGFAVPVTFPNTITWEALEQHRDARRGPRPTPGSYDTGVVENLIARSLGLRNVSSINDIGMAMSSAPAVDPTAPIHVSVTDPLWQTLSAGEFGLTLLSSYDSLAAAVADIGAARMTLVMDEMSDVDADLTVPANITLVFIDDGGVQLANGVTLTIQGPITAPSYQIFYNATAGQGTVLVTGNRKVHVYPIEWWGDDPTNTGPSINAALATLAASGKSGTVLVSGINEVTDDFQDPGGANCQIRLPESVGAMISIRLAGSTPSQTIAFRRDNQGAVIKSMLNAGNGAVIGGKVGGGAGWPIAGTSWCSITIEDLTIRTQPNPAYSGVDLTYMPNVAVRNCQISTDQDIIAAATHPPVYGVDEPTTPTSFGLKLAPANIPDQSIVDNVEIYGFYTGMVSGELANVDNTLIVFCKVGVEIPGAGVLGTLHRQDFNRLYISDCAYRLKFTGAASFVSIRALSMEHSIASPAWAQHIADIYDPDNLAHGYCGWHLTTNGTVVNDLIQEGAFYLWTESLANLAAPNANHGSSPFVAVTNSVNLTIQNEVFTPVTFDTHESDDPFGMHSVLVNTHRLVAKKEGNVHLEFNTLFAANPNGIRQVRAFKHSGILGIEILLDVQNFEPFTGANAAFDKSIKLSVNSRATDPGDYFYFVVWHNALVPLDLVNFKYRATMVQAR